MHTSVTTLASLLLAHGITRFVLCPGSRNSPLTVLLSCQEGVECRSAVDERSAGFAALGWISQCMRPVAVCVTSGSALLNLHPAVAEAAYRRLPLLVISADRPSAWIGQQDGQTLPQPGVFGALCRMCANLPEHECDAWHCNRLANEALLALGRGGGGPVHINVPLPAPHFGQESVQPLPQERVIRRLRLADLQGGGSACLAEAAARLPRRMILLGQMAQGAALPPEPEQRAFAIVGEHLCNTPQASARPDAIIGPEPGRREDLAPDLLITFGGCLVSKRLKALLRTHPPKEHWHISPEGEVTDTFQCLTLCLEGRPDELWGLPGVFAAAGDAAFAARWRSAPPAPCFPYSGMRLAGDLLAALPTPSVLHLANSSSVRYAQLFPLPPGVQTECNRGVNGIEGSLSTAIGYAMGDSRPQFLVCGDLSFFYDMNALWLPFGGTDLRILLLNNGGGGIFDTLPLPPNAFVQGKHGACARGWAESRGFSYYKVRNLAEWAPALAALTAPGPHTRVFVEAATDSAEEAALLGDYYTHH